MKLLLDVNLSPDWVGFLTQYHIESVHWSSIGSPEAPDAEIAAYALSQGYVVLTQDLDFGFLLAKTQAIGPSVILIRAGRVTPLLLGNQVLECIRRIGSEPQQPALATIDAKHTRLRLLPFRDS